MSHFILTCSPLTLSEIRAMLPATLSAHAMGAEARPLLARRRRWQTAALLLLGATSDGILEPVDVASLRHRYREDEVPRAQVIAALERHRKRDLLPEPELPPTQAFHAFVREQARAAGPCGYFRFFTAGPPLPPAALADGRELPIGAMAPDGSWLPERVLVTVLPAEPTT